MKKVFLFLVCLFALQTVVMADDDKPIQVNQLPQPAQTFIKQYFSAAKVAMAKMETDLFDKSYDVIFTNGDKLEFDKRGAWTEVNCKYSSVPGNVIPAQIQKYYHPSAYICLLSPGNFPTANSETADRLRPLRRTDRISPLPPSWRRIFHKMA